MTWGYNSNVTKGYGAVNQGNIFSHSRNLLFALLQKRKKTPDRDLVFIGHSLGGIIVKEVLRRSEIDPDEKVKKLYNATTGVLFFGTPHRGSPDWASFGEGISIMASRILGVETNSDIIHSLLPSSAELEVCRESFIAQWATRRETLTIRTYQEGRGPIGIKWGGFNKKVIESNRITHIYYPNSKGFDKCKEC